MSLDWVWNEDEENVLLYNDLKDWTHIRAKLLIATAARKQQEGSPHGSVVSSSKIVMRILLFYFKKPSGRLQVYCRLPFFISLYYEQLWYHLEQVITIAINKKDPTNNENHPNNDSASPSVSVFLSELSKSMILPMLQQEFEVNNDDDDENNKDNSVDATTTRSHAHAQEMSRLFTRLFLLLTMKGVLLSTTTTSEEEGVKGDTDTDNSPKQSEDLLLITTTVLCPFLPWYWKHQQLMAQRPSHQVYPEEERQNPDITQPLWTLIYVCLQQGRRSIVQGGSGGGGGSGRGNSSGDTQSYYSSTTSFGIASLLQRRALYLLDVVTTIPITIANTNNNIWKGYILCAETFEMECARHIVDQLWSVVITLLRQCDATQKYRNNAIDSDSDNDDDDDGDSRKTMVLPSMTSKWMELCLV